MGKGLCVQCSVCVGHLRVRSHRMAHTTRALTDPHNAVNARDRQTDRQAER